MLRRLLLAATLALCVSSDGYAQFNNCSLGSTGFCTPTGGGGGPASAATPATIFGANLVAWYTAKTGVFTSTGTLATNGQDAKIWADQSGNGYNLTARTVGAFPQFVVNSFNGRPGVGWTGANAANFKSAAVITQWAGLKTGAAFIVFIYDGQTNFATLLSTGDPTATSTADINQTQTLGVGLVQFNNLINVEQGGTSGNGQSMPPGIPGRYGIIANGTGISTFGNGGVSTPAVQANTLTTNLAIDIGCNFITATTLGTGCAGGIAAEIVFVNVSPTATQLSNLDTYFRNQWGM